MVKLWASSTALRSCIDNRDREVASPWRTEIRALRQQFSFVMVQTQ
jgi:hypothetical protein